MAVMNTKKKMLGEMLVAGGLIKEEQLKRALDEQKKRGGKVGEILVDLGFISEHNIATFLARQLHIPYIEIEKQLIDTDSRENDSGRHGEAGRWPSRCTKTRKPWSWPWQIR